MSKTAGQRLALRQLADIVNARPGALEVLGTQWADSRRDTLRVEVSLDLSGLAHAPGGIQVRARERFLLDVSPRFPYTPPAVQAAHCRWAGTPHVHWGYLLCLYAAPSVEWQPGEGMRGLIERLLLWVEKAALGELDPDNRPRHPPVAYLGDADEQVVVRANLADRVPWAEESPRSVAYLVAVCEQREARLDVIEWHAPDEFQRVLEAGWGRDSVQGGRQVAVATVLIDGEFGFEYPSRAEELAAGLYGVGVQHEAFMELIALVASANATTTGAESGPLIVMVGTPSRHLGRGPRLAHLVAWRLNSLAEEIANLLARVNRLDAPELRQEIVALGGSWLSVANTNWLRVMEDRPEVTMRRDAASSATWLAGKRILVLGSGAIGAPAAEFCVRAGASAITVVDNDLVTPGILVRQPYRDDDIGKPKAEVLARQLRRIRPATTIIGQVADAITAYDSPHGDIPPFDLIIDATADTGVRAALEVARTHAPGAWPPVLSMLIGHQARRGLVALASPGATGSGHDMFRRFGLAVNGPHHTAFADIAADFFPHPPRSTTFQPEPGCSAPTFVGSAAEVTALTGMMMTTALDVLAGCGPADSQQPMAVGAVRLGAEHADITTAQGTRWLGWPNDLTVWEQRDGFHVRISHAALAEIRAEVRRGARLRGGRIETGGMLIGALDEAAGCVFIDTATGPPPDSRLSEFHFDHGVAGAQEIIDYHRERSHRSSGFVGMWHTHPCGIAAPSPTDEAGMATLVTPVSSGPSQALMIILGGDENTWTTWRDNTHPNISPEVFARLVRRADRNTPPPIPPAPSEMTYFPGGWSPGAAETTKKRHWRRWRRWRRLRLPRRA